MNRNKNRTDAVTATVLDRMSVLATPFSVLLTGLLALFALATPGNAQTAASAEPLELTFSFGTDDSGSLRALRGERF